ncbi:predicted protein [Histoplasma capsulatum H143]|uniref:Uncharacterized protein n=1 Tax=Ajellomyces capsulatus (strain H143) TaxID=544712 RepID=C6HCR9_AJECH|nr:predicted protein [Histoplasma capsulatum H143]
MDHTTGGCCQFDESEASFPDGAKEPYPVTHVPVMLVIRLRTPFSLALSDAAGMGHWPMMLAIGSRRSWYPSCLRLYTVVSQTTVLEHLPSYYCFSDCGQVDSNKEKGERDRIQLRQ